MKKLYYLSTCDTCKRIINELELPEDIKLQDIKAEAITERDVELMFEMAGNYEDLFSKRARLYKDRSLGNQTLVDEDYRRLILEHYTFLKRPVLVLEDQIFIGNSKKVIAAAKAAIHA